MTDRASFTAVNYSLRPSKTIQRSLVFEGLRRLQDKIDWSQALYVGMGSIWFTDFILAHKILGVRKMVSVEANLIGYRRARFNKPYRFVQVKRGFSHDALPSLLRQVRYANVPHIIWLDYDGELDEGKVDELRVRAAAATDDSVLLFTLDASPKKYGANPRQRLERLGQLFGTRVVRALQRRDVEDASLSQTLGSLLKDLIANVSRRSAKSNECVPAFLIPYRDKAPMVTVGAVFPAPSRLSRVKRMIEAEGWNGFPSEPVVAPHLTGKEVATLQAALPANDDRTRTDVQDLGFDLERNQLRAFQEYYRYYPSFAQIIS